ncbi:MAG: Mrp/NBP35 family ATP-binding protein [Thermoplasmata archaeon]
MPDTPAPAPGPAAPPGPPTRRTGAPGGPLARMDKGRLRHVVAIGSGKGGVGKSSITVLLASELRRRGLLVGVLDADVTGPSVPKLMGVAGPLFDQGEGIEPARTAGDVTVISSQFLVEEEQTPVIWRGPLVTRLIMQFFGGVNWGTLDYLLIDMPPGTSDVPLTVFQTIPIDGMVFVFTPQELSALIVRKAMNMARDLHVPLLGIVENMGHMACPHCGKDLEPFGPSGVARIAEEYGVPLLARMPIDPRISILGDAGQIQEYTDGSVAALADAFLAAVTRGEETQLTVL